MKGDVSMMSSELPNLRMSSQCTSSSHCEAVASHSHRVALMSYSQYSPANDRKCLRASLSAAVIAMVDFALPPLTRFNEFLCFIYLR